MCEDSFVEWPLIEMRGESWGLVASVYCESFSIVIVKHMSVHLSTTLIVAPVQVVSELTLPYTSALSLAPVICHVVSVFLWYGVSVR